MYGVDVESGVLDERSWRWLETRVVHLLGRPSNLSRSLGYCDTSTPDLSL
ncbi:hypothetical protein [Corynebacterium sp. TAE3-ERU16]|nr:hypothetical protein [Corynebacterium sp. TAE3-ERU16]MBV7292381.1 hypothetical protein [Corynebacterium sp. TAE3-ERU16]